MNLIEVTSWDEWLTIAYLYKSNRKITGGKDNIYFDLGLLRIVSHISTEIAIPTRDRDPNQRSKS